MRPYQNKDALVIKEHYTGGGNDFIVLAIFQNQFVNWTLDKNTGHFYHGDYYNDLEDALRGFCRRAEIEIDLTAKELETDFY